MSPQQCSPGTLRDAAAQPEPHAAWWRVVRERRARAPVDPDLAGATLVLDEEAEVVVALVIRPAA